MPAHTPPVHTPYDGSTKPFTIGLKPLDPAEWFEVDARLGDYLDEKDRLYAASPDAVFRALDGTDAAQAECLALIADFLAATHPDTYRRDGDTIAIGPAGRRIGLAAEPPLWTAARLVQEDLCLMRRKPDGWTLAAAALCFPSSWSLATKIGRPMAAIHDPVPHFNGRMGDVVARIFDNLAVGRPVVRLNWSLYDNNALHRPEPHEGRKWSFGGRPDPARIFVRVERQTLSRLPASGDILFTIRIHLDPLTALADADNARELYLGLRDQLLGLDASMLGYKSMSVERDSIVALLESMAAAHS